MEPPMRRGWAHHFAMLLSLDSTRQTLGGAVSIAVDKPSDLGSEESVAQGRERGTFLVVLAVAVAASGGLIEVGLIPERLQLGGHLARVSGMDAIVLARCRKQDRRIGAAGHG